MNHEEEHRPVNWWKVAAFFAIGVVAVLIALNLGQPALKIDIDMTKRDWATNKVIATNEPPLEPPKKGTVP